MANEDRVPARQNTMMNEASQHSSACLSRASFLKVLTTGTLGAVGALMYAPQIARAALLSRQSEVTQEKKIKPGVYYIKSALNGYVLDVPDSNRAPGTGVCMYPKNSPSTQNQLWFISEDGYIQSLLNSFVLDVLRSNRNTGALVDVYPKHLPPSANQRWSFSNGYIYTALDNMVLDVLDRNPEPGTQVIVYTKDSPVSSNQKWTLVPAF